MRNKKPPFEITEAALSEVMGISELVGKISSTQNLSTSPILRRQNRIRTIYSSLAIEQNTLSLEQVTAVLSGKRVLAPPEDIAEVKNADEIYDHLAELNPYSMDDLLLAHRTMMQGLVREAGEFRSRPVGVVDSKGNVLHFGTLPQYVPSLMEELIQWTENSPLPLLIKSCVFHYEFEVIHPFADGNGRIGRLWHTLLLSKWNPLFAWLPIESIIHDHQAEYYAAINQSNAQGEGTVFIEFMLGIIKEALTEAINEQPVAQSKEEVRWMKIAAFLRTNHIIQNVDVQNLLNVSPATASRVLNTLTKEGKLAKVRNGRYWAYRVADGLCTGGKTRLRLLAEQTRQQRNEGDADEGNAAASHELLHALTLGGGVIAAVTFQQVDSTPHAETGTQSHNQSLKNFDSRVKEFHSRFSFILKKL